MSQNNTAQTISFGIRCTLSSNNIDNRNGVNFIGTNDGKLGIGARNNGDEDASQPMLRFMDNAQNDSVSSTRYKTLMHLKRTVKITRF